jgi:hypothetical protein
MRLIDYCAKLNRHLINDASEDFANFKMKKVNAESELQKKHDEHRRIIDRYEWGFKLKNFKP